MNKKNFNSFNLCSKITSNWAGYLSELKKSKFSKLERKFVQFFEKINKNVHINFLEFPIIVKFLAKNKVVLKVLK